MEFVVGASLLASVFLGGATSFFGIPAILSYLIKTLFIVFMLAYVKSAVARIRIDQMIRFGWRVLAPLSLLGMLLVVIFNKGGLL